MSGYKGSRTRSGAPVNACATLAFRVVLSSPQASVLSKLKRGDILAVQLDPYVEGGVNAVLVEEPAGAITGGRKNSLVICLQNGYRFVAEVIDLTGGLCTVDVRPA
ncbi:MAG: hypothetical protein DI587_11035 [Variovorax paradoxus]|nr:MAG: hypothetical protein DI583_11035 [Variovorax paradoxus]PZQ10985.1 MAG: hypothetical protein DI587_11035 [Variovorax paradoxus]